MKPTRPGFYWYKGEPVKVWESTYSGELCFDRFCACGYLRVEHTDPEDWGPEIEMEKRCNGCGCILKADDLCFDCFEYSEIKGDGNEL